MISFPQLLKIALKFKASDIHIVAGAPPVLRVSGDMIPLKTDMLTPNDTKKLIYSILTDKQKSVVEKDKDYDFSVGVKGLCRCRGNISYQRGSLAGVFRLLPNSIPRIESLGLPAEGQNLASYKSGLVLITGKTGSGKTTTIASLIQAITENTRRHVVTLEDPIEYTFNHTKSIFKQREIGHDTQSYERSMRSLLRQDADICFLGELIDKTAIEVALRLAETGHLVLSTLHTNTAVGTIQRILSNFSHEEQNRVQSQLASTLNSVFAQQLIKGTNGKLVLACEMLKVKQNIQNLIREGKFHQIYGSMQSGQKDSGMLTMNQCLFNLVRTDKLDIGSAIANSTEPDELIQMIQKNKQKSNKVA